jgi:hypothetical protein
MSRKGQQNAAINKSLGRCGQEHFPSALQDDREGECRQGSKVPTKFLSLAHPRHIAFVSLGEALIFLSSIAKGVMVVHFIENPAELDNLLARCSWCDFVNTILWKTSRAEEEEGSDE